MKKLFLFIALLLAFAGNVFAQNSINWNQDGMRCKINLFTGDFSITCVDNAGNAFTIFGPEYDFDLSLSSGTINYNGSRVEWVGNTHIIYNGSRVEWIGNTHIIYNGSRVEWVGNTHIIYNGSKVEWIGNTHIIYNGSRIEWVGNAHIFYNGSSVSSISGRVN